MSEKEKAMKERCEVCGDEAVGSFPACQKCREEFRDAKGEMSIQRNPVSWAEFLASKKQAEQARKLMKAVYNEALCENKPEMKVEFITSEAGLDAGGMEEDGEQRQEPSGYAFDQTTEVTDEQWKAAKKLAMEVKKRQEPTQHPWIGQFIVFTDGTGGKIVSVDGQSATLDNKPAEETMMVCKTEVPVSEVKLRELKRELWNEVRGIAMRKFPSWPVHSECGKSMYLVCRFDRWQPKVWGDFYCACRVTDETKNGVYLHGFSVLMSNALQRQYVNAGSPRIVATELDADEK